MLQGTLAESCFTYSRDVKLIINTTGTCSSVTRVAELCPWGFVGIIICSCSLIDVPMEELILF